MFSETILLNTLLKVTYYIVFIVHCFQKSFWCGTSVKSDQYDAPINSSGELLTPPGNENFKSIPDTEFFEAEVPGLRKVVEVHSLHKVNALQ